MRPSHTHKEGTKTVAEGSRAEQLSGTRRKRNNCNTANATLATLDLPLPAALKV